MFYVADYVLLKIYFRIRDVISMILLVAVTVGGFQYHHLSKYFPPQYIKLQNVCYCVPGQSFVVYYKNTHIED